MKKNEKKRRKLETVWKDLKKDLEVLEDLVKDTAMDLTKMGKGWCSMFGDKE